MRDAAGPRLFTVIAVTSDRYDEPTLAAPAAFELRGQFP